MTWTIAPQGGRALVRAAAVGAALLLAACSPTPTGPAGGRSTVAPARADSTAQLAPAGAPLTARNGYMLSGGRGPSADQ